MNFYSFASLLLIIMFVSTCPGQSISGRIHSNTNDGITAVKVSIPLLQRYTSSDSSGYFQFDHIPIGKYAVVFTRADYKNILRFVSIYESNIILDVQLEISPIEIPVVTVSASAQPSSVFRNPNSITIVDEKDLRLNRGQSIMQSLEWSPGISLFSGSMLSVKPIIRGLTAQRIIIARDGDRIEGQTWDEPQSTETDAFDVERIEVVHGPMSVLYGSDALGGVVNLVRTDVFMEHNDHILDGAATINLFSGNTQGSAGVTLFGSSNAYHYRAQLSGRYAGDYSTPSGKSSNGTIIPSGAVFNSGAQEFDGTVRFGIRKDWGTMEFDYSHFGQLYFISPEPGRKEFELNIHTNMYDSLPAAPKQEIFHETFSAKMIAPISAGILELRAIAQYNSRKEEGVAESDEDEVLKEEKGIKPEALLDLYAATIDLRLHHQPIGSISGTVGGSFNGQRNQTLGMNAVIPNFTTKTLSGFVYEDIEIDPLVSIAAGLRGDIRSMSVMANDSLLNPSSDIRYTSLNGTAGIVVNPFESFVVTANYGTGWRSPSASELFTRGKDEGTIRYKIGNSSLVSEYAQNIELSFRVIRPMGHAEFNVFTNSIKNFIYLDPTGTTSGGLPVFSYRQSNATIRGGEFSVEAFITESFGLNAGIDYLETKNERLRTPLPLQPANKLKAGVSLLVLENHSSIAQGFAVNSLHAIVRMKYVAAQNKVTALETVTPNYQLFDVGIQGDCSFGSSPFAFSMMCENIFNTAYYDHLSRYKEYALNPGLNMSLKISTPFTIIQ